MLKEKVVEDLKQAMLARDELKTSTLRMLKAAIMKFEVSGKEKVEVSDEDVMALIKKRSESAQRCGSAVSGWRSSRNGRKRGG